MIFAATLMAVLLYLDRICVGIAADYIRADLRVTQAEMASFLSVFFWSYALGQVPSGWLSDRFGSRIMLVIYIATWSLFTALLGAVHSLVLLLVMRLGIGLGQAGAYPTAGSMISRWVPLTSRATASSLVAFGGRVGGALAPLLTAWTIILLTSNQPAEFLDRELIDGLRACELLAPIEGEISTRTHVFDSLSTDAQSLITEKARAAREAERFISQQSGSTLNDLRLEKMRLTEQYRNNLQLADQERLTLLTQLNLLLDRIDLFDPSVGASVNSEAKGLLRLREEGRISPMQVRRLNRLMMEAELPDAVAKLYGRGWRPTMLIYGGLGIFVAALFWFLVRSRPEDHPGCNSAELALIEEGRKPVVAPEKPSPFPLVPLLLSRSMWLNCFMQIGTNIGWLFLITWFPRYLSQVHKVPLAQQGVMSAVTLVVGILGMLSGGWLTDQLTRSLGLRWGRGLPMLVTRFTAAAAFLACVGFSTLREGDPLNSPWAFTIALSLVAFSTDLGNPAVWAFCQDVGGRNVGSVLGWGNMWGNFGAALAPPIYNHFLGEQPSIDNWNTMFLVCAGAFVFSGICALGVDCTRPLVVEQRDPA